MNKPIIIDGVDVSECEFKSLFDNRCCSFADDTENLNCNNKDCYYKQLQRLKAENERLKKEVSDLNFYIDNYKITWEIDKCEKYKQALEEVRELANKRNVGCGKFCEVNRKEHNCNAECNAYYLKQIKDKIDEVLKDERTIKIS